MVKILPLLFVLLTVIPARAAQDLAPTPDLPQRLLELRARAESGDADAQLNLGGIYFKGLQVRQDYAEGLKWFRLAAQQGQAQAQYNLGMIYASGLGVPQNHTEAARWYRLAAEQGLSIAQLNLGVAYDYGDGVERNEAEALKWIGLAARQGEAQAQFNLAVMYANGQGVPQDMTQAYRWAKLAADQGHETARALLADLNKAITSKQPQLANTLTEPATTGSATATFYIQLGAIKLKSHAETRAEKLMAQMHDKLGELDKPYRIFIDNDWVRIQVGPYPSLDEARRSADSLKEKLNRYPLIKQY